MPQVDLETLVSACAGVDRKIACETLAAATATATTATVISDNHQPSELEEIPPDFPPESFWLSKDAEFDWFDRNAFFERKDSGKGNSNSTNLNPNIHSNPSNSQRYSNLKSKASIIGLPKPQKSYVDSKNRRNCKPANIRLFPKRSSSTNIKSDSSLVEPSSPKVSCMGRVRSKRDRNRRLRNRQRSKRYTEPDTKKEKPERTRKSGFFASFKAMFRQSHKQAQTEKVENDKSYKKSTVKSSDIRERLPASDRDALQRMRVDGEPAANEPVALGGMKRFASGRRSESWGVGVEAA